MKRIFARHYRTGGEQKSLASSDCHLFGSDTRLQSKIVTRSCRDRIADWVGLPTEERLRIQRSLNLELRQT
jgi:hypothetical protein